MHLDFDGNERVELNWIRRSLGNLPTGCRRPAGGCHVLHPSKTGTVRQDPGFERGGLQPGRLVGIPHGVNGHLASRREELGRHWRVPGPDASRGGDAYAWGALVPMAFRVVAIGSYGDVCSPPKAYMPWYDAIAAAGGCVHLLSDISHEGLYDVFLKGIFSETTDVVKTTVTTLHRYLLDVESVLIET